MTPRRIREEIRDKKQTIESFQQMLKHSSDEKTQKTYTDLIETYQKQLQELEDQLRSQGKKSKGNISIKDENVFDGKPFLTVSIDKSFTKRPTLDSIRMYWTPVSDSRCEQLVEEKGYVVGVINKVILGVVQVDDWKRHEKKEGEKLGRVEFTGKLLSDHPSIEYSLKERTVSGTIQGFRFKDNS